MATPRPFAALTGREKTIEILRWFAVLPAAILARLATRLMMGLLLRAVFGGMAASGFVHYLQILLIYSPKVAAFVLAGAAMAPRRRLPIASVLAVAAILMSLAMHMLSQTDRGVINYVHFSAESLGAIFGAAYLFVVERKSRRARRSDQPASNESQQEPTASSE